MKIVLGMTIAVIALGLFACSKPMEDKSAASTGGKAKLRSDGNAKKPFHGEMDKATSKIPVSLVQESLKKNHLEVSSTKTIGEAFDNYKYATKKEWRDTPAANDSYFVDYICWIDISPVSLAAIREGVVKRALNVKFAIRSSGETYIGTISRIDTKSDGMIYTTVIDPTEFKKIITAIYENREIPF